MIEIHSSRDSLIDFSQISERTPVYGFRASMQKTVKIDRTLKNFSPLIKPTPFQKKTVNNFGSFSNQLSYTKQHPAHLISFPLQQCNTEPDPSSSFFCEESTTSQYLMTSPEEYIFEISKSILKKGRKSRFSRALFSKKTTQRTVSFKGNLLELELNKNKCSNELFNDN